ncbi:MAG: hypothetical protein ACT4OJ_14155 [Bacteroidota bacterium]
MNTIQTDKDKAINIMDRVKSFEDACSVLNVRAADVINGSEDADEAAYKKLKSIAKALNEGWVPDWTNNRQYKYFPWFDLSSGSGLSYDVFAGRVSYSSVGSRLCFKSRELADYAGKHFIDLYTDFFIIK